MRMFQSISGNSREKSTALLPHFDICDLLLDRCTATWNLFVKYKSWCRSVVLSFISSKKFQATECLLLKILMLCFLQGTSLVRQTLLLHCEHVTMHGVDFRIPRWHYCVILKNFSPLQACALLVINCHNVYHTL